MSVGVVRTRLRQGLAAASAYVERGRVATRKALYGVIFGIASWLTGRQLLNEAQRPSTTGSDHVLQASVALAAGAVAVAVFMANPVSPAGLSQFDRGAGSMPASAAPSTDGVAGQPHEVEVSLSSLGGSLAHGVLTGVLPSNVLPATTIITNVPSGPITVIVPVIKVPDRIVPELPPAPAVPKLKKPLL